MASWMSGYGVEGLDTLVLPSFEVMYVIIDVAHCRVGQLASCLVPGGREIWVVWCGVVGMI